MKFTLGLDVDENKLAHFAGLFDQPWNRELVAQRVDVHGFSDWREVPDLLPVL